MLPGPPEFGQRELIVGINQRGNGRVEFLLGDVMLVDPRDLPPVKGLESLSGLGRPQITAIAKGRGYIARLDSLQPCVLARERAKAPRPMEPIFCVGQDIEDIDGLESFRD